MAENPEEEVVEEATPPQRRGMVLPVVLAILAAGAGSAVGMTILGPPAGAWMAAESLPGQGPHGFWRPACLAIYVECFFVACHNLLLFLSISYNGLVDLNMRKQYRPLNCL